MTEACKKCGGTDFNKGGNCRACRKAYNKAYRETRTAKKTVGKSEAKKRAKSSAKSTVAAAEAATTAIFVLEVQQGYGFKAWIDDPYLMIEQTDADKTETVCLSRAEVRQLIEKFGSWAA